jgi:hypothetical protein
VFSECRKCYFRDPNFKNFLGACPQIPLANRLTPSAIAHYPGGRARKMGPLAVLPHHWRILKKFTAFSFISTNLVYFWKYHTVSLFVRPVHISSPIRRQQFFISLSTTLSASLSKMDFRIKIGMFKLVYNETFMKLIGDSGRVVMAFWEFCFYYNRFTKSDQRLIRWLATFRNSEFHCFLFDDVLSSQNSEMLRFFI